MIEPGEYDYPIRMIRIDDYGVETIYVEALLHAPGRSAPSVYKANDARWGTEIFWGEIVEFGAKRHETRAEAAAASYWANFGEEARIFMINDAVDRNGTSYLSAMEQPALLDFSRDKVLKKMRSGFWRDAYRYCR